MDSISSSKENGNHFKQFQNGVNKQVRSYSCIDNSLLQHPQLSDTFEREIVDLTNEENGTPSLPLTRPISPIPAQKIPEHSLSRRLSKYISKHRKSIAVVSSDFVRDHEKDMAKLLGKSASKNRSQSLQEFQKSNQSDFRNSLTELKSSTIDEDPLPSSPPSPISREFRKKSGSGLKLNKRDSVTSSIESSSNMSSLDFEKIQDWDSFKMDFDEQKRSTLSIREPYDFCCKILLLGDSGVGKTCLLMKFKEGAFLSGAHISTIGIDFRNKVINLDDSKIKLQIWDTAGQERFRSVTHAYYRDAHALLLLYDVTSKSSFDNTREWLAEVHEYAQDDVVIMLIGNKCDAQPSERQIRREDGERLAKEYNVAFMETSAKSGLNVDLAFTAVAKDLKERKLGKNLEKKFNVAEYVENQERFENCVC